MVQSVLILSAETWLVNPHMDQVLGAFQDQVDQKLTGRLPRWQAGGKWEYTFVTTARDEAGFEVMEEYIRRRRKTVAQYIDTQLFLDLCEAIDRKPGVRVGVRL